MTNEDSSELRRYYLNYVNENLDHKYSNDIYFKNFLNIIEIFSKKPMTTQKEIFGKLNFSNKEDLINLNKVVWNSKLAQNLILEKKYQ